MTLPRGWPLGPEKKNKNQSKTPQSCHGNEFQFATTIHMFCVEVANQNAIQHMCAFNPLQQMLISACLNRIKQTLYDCQYINQITGKKLYGLLQNNRTTSRSENSRALVGPCKNIMSGEVGLGCYRLLCQHPVAAPGAEWSCTSLAPSTWLWLRQSSPTRWKTQACPQRSNPVTGSQSQVWQDLFPKCVVDDLVLLAWSLLRVCFCGLGPRRPFKRMPLEPRRLPCRVWIACASWRGHSIFCLHSLSAATHVSESLLGPVWRVTSIFLMCPLRSCKVAALQSWIQRGFHLNCAVWWCLGRNWDQRKHVCSCQCRFCSLGESHFK